MEVMKVVIIAILGWVCHFVAQLRKRFAPVSAAALDCYKQILESLVMTSSYQINKASRGVSGNYWINTTTGAHQVYCDMELECGGHKGGWMRIANLDTSRGDDCPSGWTKITIY